MNAPRDRPLLGVLAGGRGERMGGRDKAELLAPGGTETLLARLLRVGAALDLDCVVVGGRARGGVRVLSDAPGAEGPIGGLAALLEHAGGRIVLALACDMPYVSAPLLGTLLAAHSEAAVLAARDPECGKWQPWFARYDSARVLPPLRAAIARGERSLQPVFATLSIEELRLDAAEHAQLRDWDLPSDIE